MCHDSNIPELTRELVQILALLLPFAQKVVVKPLKLGL